ncbi:amino acid permease 2 [Coccidioides immitis H538.4]|uniref:Amino acid permease n=5 Tax=Coccidioides TaxID=5500 RepID=E9D425_COCPS|nr:amino acid permease [Coccidioides posadasii str. Silveira]KMP07319.1 amino acid permease 2 [Coccidioides immitis RMSCC 2394]KMU72228.1 amino acid permease 2 [Coccidioides immitis RMSCC 3703]KMU82398.1 amino acid permease 2 [Coccidioides immitis H538.4]
MEDAECYKLDVHSRIQSIDSPKENEKVSSGGYGSKIVEDQTRIKRLFNFTQIFFFALTFMSSWETMALNLTAVFTNGGPQALAWGILVVVSGALAQSASLAEMAAMQPIAGAQYHWTHHLAPPRQRRFITWMQGWITWFAWVSLLAGVANTTANMIQGLAIINYPNYQPERWHLTMIMFAMLIIEGLMNMYTFWLIPWVELLAGILHIVLFIVFVVVLVCLAPRHTADFVFAKGASASGWNNRYVSWNLGLLTPTWGFVGFDGAVHMSEEVRRAKKAMPRSIFWTVATNGVLAYAIIIVILFTMGPLENALQSSFPIIEICRQATGSVRAATAMVCGLLVISLAVNLASIASASRLTWAWSRDGALPSWFSYIDRKHCVPVRAVWLPIAIVMVLACLNIASVTAFGAFIALSSIGLFTSYLIAIGCMVHARFFQTHTLQFGEWNMGRLGLPVNIFAICYTIYVIIWLPFPSLLPVTGENMNYCLPIFAASTLFALSLWFLRAKKHWGGLNKEVIRLVVEGGELNLK